MVAPLLDRAADGGDFGRIALAFRTPLGRRIEQSRKGGGGRRRGLQPFLDLLRPDAKVGEARIVEPPPEAREPARQFLRPQLRRIESEPLRQPTSEEPTTKLKSLILHPTA